MEAGNHESTCIKYGYISWSTRHERTHSRCSSQQIVLSRQGTRCLKPPPHTIAMHNICKATHTNSTCDQNQILIRCSCPNHWNLQPPLAAGWPRSGAGNSAPGDSHHHTRRFLHSSVAHSSGRGEVWLVIGLAQ